jgi:hypothetical protein
MSDPVEAATGGCELCLKGSKEKDVFVLHFEPYEGMTLCAKHMHVLLSKKQKTKE